MVAESFSQPFLAPVAATRSALGRRPRLMFVVNADWFFVSHRLALAAACVEAGFDVSVCAGETAARKLIDRRGLRFIALPIDRGGTDPRADLGTVSALVRTYAREKPDIVHHVTVKPIVYGSIAARITRVPGIVNAVSGLGYAFITRPDERLRHRVLRQLVVSLYRLAFAGNGVRAIFQNESDLATFVDAKLVGRSKTHLIRGSGVDFARFQSRPLPPGEFVALLPARLLWDKGIAEFVEAARRLRARFPRARFVLLGRGDPGNPAAIPDATVRDWVRAGVIEWWGHCEHSEMPDVLSRAHVVVLPSYREGLPLALAEAAALGRACVTTDVPGCRDAIEHGETGWLVPARDAERLAAALEHAVLDRPELERRGTSAVDFAHARFGLDAIVASTLKVYDQLLSRVSEQRR
jgi:glycosyltransferase involved in cell wall biosynthesis